MRFFDRKGHKEGTKVTANWKHRIKPPVNRHCLPQRTRRGHKGHSKLTALSEMNDESALPSAQYNFNGESVWCQFSIAPLTWCSNCQLFPSSVCAENRSAQFLHSSDQVQTVSNQRRIGMSPSGEADSYLELAQVLENFQRCELTVRFQ